MFTFMGLTKIIRSARDPVKGKPMNWRTRVRLTKGTKHDPECIAVKFYDTDIAKFYPDGTRKVICSWFTAATNEALREWAGVYRYNQQLPLFNGRKPSPEKLACVSTDPCYWHSGREHIVNNAWNDGWIVIKDNEIDRDTIKPKKVEIISNPKKLRDAQARIRKVCKKIEFTQWMGYDYLNNQDIDEQFNQSASFNDWLIWAADQDLETLEVTRIPRRGMSFMDKKLITAGVASTLAYTLCRRMGLMEEIEIKTFTR